MSETEIDYNKYEITRYVRDTDFEPLFPPEIEEIQPKKTPNRAAREERENDPDFVNLLHFNLIIIIQKLSSPIEELGLDRGYEDTQSHDIYLFTVKARDQRETMGYVRKLRDNLVKRASKEIYNRYEFDNVIDIDNRGEYILEFNIRAYRSGKRRLEI
jgi:hypothetical protein